MAESLRANHERTTSMSGLEGLGRGEQAGADFAADRENLETMRDLLSQARIRLDQYIGICKCPGESCVSACRECDATQDLVNRIRGFMQGRSAR